MTGTSTSRTMSGTARAASSLLTVTRTSSLPDSARARTCATVAATSAVSVLVMDWTTIGWQLPTWTPPTSTVTVRLRSGPVMRSPSLGRRFSIARFTVSRGAVGARQPSSNCNDEEPAEREQGPAVGPRWVGAGDPACVLGEENRALRLFEGVEEWLERGAAGPLDDRIVALQHVEVLRLPDVEARDVWAQDDGVH